MTRKQLTGLCIAAAAAYIAVIALANWAIAAYGVVPIGFGLSAPAAVYFVGVALVLRDAVQVTASTGSGSKLIGRVVAVCALIIGVGVSFVSSTAGVAGASAAAFACSELLDFAVFTWVAPRWARAVAAAGIVGAVADTFVFLTLVPTLVPGLSNYHFASGQIVGKLYGVALAVVVVPLVRRAVAGRVAEPAIA